MTTERRPLRMDSTSSSTVRTSCVNSSRRSGMRPGSALVTETIGGRSPRADDAAAAGDQRAGGADQLRHRQELDVLGALCRQRLDTKHALRVPCDRHRRGSVRSMPWRLSARTAAIWVSSTPGTDTAAEVKCLAFGPDSSAASARTQRIGSKPIGRTTTSSLATGWSSSSASPARVANSASMPADDTSSSRASSQALPCPPKATAYGSPAVSRSHQGVAGLRRLLTRRRGRWSPCRVH